MSGLSLVTKYQQPLKKIPAIIFYHILEIQSRNVILHNHPSRKLLFLLYTINYSFFYFKNSKSVINKIQY